MPVGAAILSVREGVGTAISEFPVANGGLGNVDTESHTCRENADQSCSDPSLTRLEQGAKDTA